MNGTQRPTIDYTNKDYESLREAMLKLARERLPEWTDHSPNDLGVLLVELFAYMGDIMLYYQDRIADESYLDTAVERRSIVRLLRLLGYELRSERPASADLTLVFEEDCTSADIIPGTAFETSSNATGSKVRFEYVRPETLTIVQPPKDLKDRWETRDGKQNVWLYRALPVVQVDSNVGVGNENIEIIGSSDGSVSQRFRLARTPLLEIEDSPAISVIEGPIPILWERKSTLLNSHSNDSHYTVLRDDTGVAWIEFGDGKYGRIPSAGVNNIRAGYYTGGGAKGNVPPLTIVNPTGRIAGLVNVYNEKAASGGADAEDAAEAARRGPHLFRANDRAVTAQDYEAHARYFGLGKVRARKATWNRVELYVAPSGGGFPSDTLKEDLRAYFDDKRMLTTIVEILDPAYAAVEIEGTLAIEPYYFAEQVQQKVNQALMNLLAFENVSFEYRLYLSKIYEAMEAIEGVANVYISILRRRQALSATPIPAKGVLEFGWNEIPQVTPITWSWNERESIWKWTTIST